MLLANKNFVKTLCPLLAVLFFIGTISPNMVLAQASGKCAERQSIALLQTAIAAKNSGMSSDEPPEIICEQLKAELQRLLGAIEASGMSGNAMPRLMYLLPPVIADVLQSVIEVAHADMPAEQKVDALVTTLSSLDCNTIMTAAVFVYVLTYFRVIPNLGYIANVLFAAAVLCYFGYL